MDKRIKTDRSRFLAIRVSSKELDDCHEMAQDKGLSITWWIRNVIAEKREEFEAKKARKAAEQVAANAAPVQP